MDPSTPLESSHKSESSMKSCHCAAVTSPTDPRTACCVDQDELHSLVTGARPALDVPSMGNGVLEEPSLSMSSLRCTLFFSDFDMPQI